MNRHGPPGAPRALPHGWGLRSHDPRGEGDGIFVPERGGEIGARGEAQERR